jgi:transcription initiation factor TFIIIB Brf1 subunit/transcription initiation factor TFIIB
MRHERKTKRIEDVSAKRNLAKASACFTQASNLGVVSRKTLNAAKELYERAVVAGLTKGKAMEASVAAAIYVVARKHHEHMSIDAISSALMLNVHDVKTKVKGLVDEFNIHLPYTSPIDCLDEACEAVKGGAEFRDEAERLLAELSNHGVLVGKTPCAVAVAAVLYCSQNPRRMTAPQLHLLKKVGRATNQTIREHFKEIAEWQHKLI